MRDAARRFVGVLAGTLAVTLALLTLGALVLRASVTGWALLLAAWAVVAAAFAVARRARQAGRAALAAFALLASVLATRAALVRGDGASVRLVTLPAGSGARLVDRLVDERDGALLGAQLMSWTRSLPENDARIAVTVLRAGYDRMTRAEGPLPTPAIATYLGLQTPQSFDALVMSPTGADAHVGVVFLHGLGGSFDLEAWQFAAGPRRAGATVVCPSIGPAGDWWSPRGERVLRETLAWMRARGFRRPILAGLSNGGVGACVLAPRLVDSLGAIVLVSGAARGVTPPPGLPVLAVHGRSDRMASIADARAYVRAAGAQGAMIELDAGHLALLVEHERIERELERWVAVRAAAIRAL